MVSRKALVQYLDQLLDARKVSDYCPNGLQVSGKENIKTLVTGVTACRALLEAAVHHQADAVLVHHGYFWKNEPLPLTDMKYARLQVLFSNQISLLAYHLPLDLHLQYGNNIQLAQVLNIETQGQWLVEGLPLIFHGSFTGGIQPKDLSEYIEKRLNRKPLFISGGRNMPIQKVAWCTGAAQQFIELAARQGADAYLTGEVSEATTHVARELGIDFFACGHHATERYGVQALGEHLAAQFGIQHQFVDIENPV